MEKNNSKLNISKSKNLCSSSLWWSRIQLPNTTLSLLIQAKTMPKQIHYGFMLTWWWQTTQKSQKAHFSDGKFNNRQVSLTATIVLSSLMSSRYNDPLIREQDHVKSVQRLFKRSENPSSGILWEQKKKNWQRLLELLPSFNNRTFHIWAGEHSSCSSLSTRDWR